MPRQLIRFLFLSYSLCFSVEIKGQEIEATLAIEIPKDGLHHVSLDENKRWNFVSINRNSLTLTITSSKFEWIKSIEVENLQQYQIHHIIGIDISKKELHLFYQSNRDRHVKVLKVHKFNNETNEVGLDIELQESDIILRSFSAAEYYHIFTANTKDELSLISISDELKTSNTKLKTEFPYGQQWKNQFLSYPQGHCFVSKQHSLASFKETAVAIKIYPSKNAIKLTYDEPFKTQTLSIDLNLWTWQEHTYQMSFPENIPLSDNFTNSFIWDGILFQAMTGKWGLSIQKTNLDNDSASSAIALHFSDQKAQSLIKCYTENCNSENAKVLELSDWKPQKWNDAIFGFSCSGTNSRLNFNLGFVKWNYIELLKTESSDKPVLLKPKVAGIKHSLYSPFNQQEQFKYNYWKETGSTYLSISISNWEFDFIKYMGNGITDLPMFRLYEKKMKSNLIFASHATFFQNDDLIYYGFYNNRKKLFYIIKI